MKLWKIYDYKLIFVYDYISYYSIKMCKGALFNSQ